MEVMYWREYKKNTLQGFFSTKFDNGLIVKDMTFHIKGDNKWVGFPSKSYEQANETKWTNICYFPEKDRGTKFQDAIIPLVEAASNA